MLRMLVVVAMLTGPAIADDETSEHTAQLIGDKKDTIGVHVGFDEHTGWSMSVGDPNKTKPLTVRLKEIPTHHSHYLVYVAKGRKAIAIVETRAGVTQSRTALAATDKLAWVYSPQGKLVGSYTYGQVLTADEIDMPDRSVSHMMWFEGQRVTARGIEFEIAQSKRKVRLDASGTRFAK